MNKIRILSSEVSMKIAAGEVVERPASVVKELVENSLDAGSTEIKVELIEGGKRLIRVTDNGYGMTKEDALICFERHSTSKISGEDDLNHISTLGFRGEALPSISAVSRMVLKTSAGEENPGFCIDREGEKVISAEEIAFPQGTSVEVRNLFFNLPARRKFLRSENAELSLITSYLTTAALAHFDVRFSLVHGKREIFNYSVVPGIKERIFQIFGRSVLERLLDIDFKDGDLHLWGYASCPPTGRRDRKHQYFFVNDRPVKDKILIAALNQAYKPFLEKDYSPEAFLFLELPLSDVDVNVHPAKTEVRFKDTNQIFRLINRSIEFAVLKEMGIKDVYPEEPREKKTFKVEEIGEPQIFKAPWEERGSGSNRNLETVDSVVFAQKAEKSEIPHVLGQYMNMYIVAVDAEGILVIDQHNAHERILFEKYLELDREKKWPVKLALMPMVFDLSPSQEIDYEKSKDLLEQMGFRVEPMGGRSYALKEYPEIFQEKEAEEILLSLLDEAGKEKIEEKKEKMLALLACKTAIKAHEPMAYEKMSFLVQELFKTKNPGICPHGRPIVVRLGKSDIERSLGRR